MAQLPHIPGYELIEYLGGGAMTCVFSARELPGDDLVAIKMLRPDFAEPDTALTLLRREARGGLGVRHPHLVPVRFAALTSTPYFLVMDFLPGESLRRLMHRDYRVPPTLAILLARQIGEALAALHRAGLVHGDVKPENIWLTGSGSAKLIDLGFSHQPGENADFLKKGLLLGTANYLAPELCALDPNADGRSDVFSLGVVLFEMLTGVLPFAEGTMAETLWLHRHDFPADLRDYAGPWPKGTRRLLQRLLARRPADRLSALTAVQELMGLEIQVLRSLSA